MVKQASFLNLLAGKRNPKGSIVKAVIALVFCFAASSQTAIAFSAKTDRNNAGWGDHLYFDRHTLDCGLSALSRVQLHVSLPVGWTASGRWHFHYDCHNAYQDGSITKYTGWNHDGNGNAIYLDRHGIDCGNKPLQHLKLQTTSGDQMRYKYKCGTSSLTNITNHYTPANNDGQGDIVAWNGIYLDRHNVDCPSGKALTYMRLQRPSSSTIRYHYKCGTIQNVVTRKANKTVDPVVFLHGMGGAPHNFSDSFGNPIENSPWMANGQQILRTHTSPLHTSEVRGRQAYDQIVSFMVATGATKVNLVGHSQGGLDMRKVAHLLKATSINGALAGQSKVGTMISLQGPHRGSPVAQRVWDIDNALFGVVSFIDDLSFISNPVFDLLAGNGGGTQEFMEAIHQLLPSTMVSFNNKYPSEGVANYVGSIVTSQEQYGHNLWVGRQVLCRAAVDLAMFGGNTPPGKDDCLVTVDSAQMGHRLVYNLNNCSGSNCNDPLNSLSQTSVPYVSNLNYPGTGGSDLNTGVMEYDHFDMVYDPKVPHDGGFDEHEFYAALVDFIASKDPTWQGIGGALKQIDVGSEVWGVNANDQIFKRSGGGWTQIPGRLKHVSVGPTGDVWGVNSSDYIYRYNRASNNWTQMPGRLKQIDVGSQVWGVNANDDIFKWNGSGWTHIPGKLRHVTVGARGEVWGVNSGHYIYRYNNGSNNWTRIPGRLKQIDLGAGLWGVNGADDIFEWSGTSGWTKKPGKLKHVSVDRNNRVWGVNSSNHIYKYRNLSQGINTQTLAIWSGPHSRYMVAEGNGGSTVNANRTAAGPWETFTMSAPNNYCIVHGSVVNIRTSSNFYWSAQSSGALDGNRTSIGSWEKFVVINHSDRQGCLRNNDLISLRSQAHNKYVVAESNGTANANRTGIGSWEKFRVRFK